MSTNLEYRARERQRKRESRRQASEAQREKGRQRSRARDKKQRRHFFVGRTTWKFCSDGDNAIAATNARRKRVKKVNENTYDISSIKKFHAVVVQRTTAKKCTKKVCCKCKVAFLLIRPIIIFHRSPALPRRLALHDSIFCLNKL